MKITEDTLNNLEMNVETMVGHTFNNVWKDVVISLIYEVRALKNKN